MALMNTDFSVKVEKETLSLSDGTTLEVTKQPGIDDRSWDETKRYLEANPEEARRIEEAATDAKATRDTLQMNQLWDFYQTKLANGDEFVSNKVLGLEKNPDFAHIFEDIKRGGQQAAMQHYYNEPLMLKMSRAVNGIPEEVYPLLENIHKSPMTIQEAAKMGCSSDIADYIRSGSDIEAKDSKGVTSLGYAIGANRAGVVKQLMDAKANPAEVDSNGGSGLHYAAAYGRKELLEFLLKTLDVNKKNTQGQTPLALATKNKQVAAIDLLKSKGGNI